MTTIYSGDGKKRVWAFVNGKRKYLSEKQRKKVIESGYTYDPFAPKSKKSVKRKKVKRTRLRKKPRVTIARKNPLPKYIIRAKIKNRGSFYYDGSRLTNSKTAAKRYLNIAEAKRYGERVWLNFPSVASVGVIKA